MIPFGFVCNHERFSAKQRWSIGPIAVRTNLPVGDTECIVKSFVSAGPSSIHKVRFGQGRDDDCAQRRRETEVAGELRIVSGDGR